MSMNIDHLKVLKAKGNILNMFLVVSYKSNKINKKSCYNLDEYFRYEIQKTKTLNFELGN